MVGVITAVAGPCRCARFAAEAGPDNARPHTNAATAAASTKVFMTFSSSEAVTLTMLAVHRSDAVVCALVHILDFVSPVSVGWFTFAGYKTGAFGHANTSGSANGGILRFAPT